MESHEIIDRLAVAEEAEQAEALGVISSELSGTIQSSVSAEITSGIAVMDVPKIEDKLKLLVTMEIQQSTAPLYESIVAEAIAEIEAVLNPA